MNKNNGEVRLVKEICTTRKISMTRKNNKEKIMDTLKSIKKPLTTTELAKESNIDIKNITRYLKALESEYLIKRDIIQKGKIRLVMVSLTTRKEIDTTRKIKDKIDITPKEPILTKDIEKEILEPTVIKTIPVIHRKPVVHKEALTEKKIEEIIDKRIREILKKETVKERKLKINAEKIFLKLQSLDAEAPENAFYKVIIKSRAQTGRRSYLDSYVHFINKHPDEFIEEA